MEMFQILKCSDHMLVVVNAVQYVLGIIRWGIPIVLIVMGSIDMFKAMASGDEKKTQEARKTFIRRLIYAVVAFLIPFIISLVFEMVGKIVTTDNDDLNNVNNNSSNFFECWYGDVGDSGEDE